ncbi:MAG: AAA family ATPase [Bacteroides fragilis]
MNMISPCCNPLGMKNCKKEFRKTLQAFYGAIKTMYGYIRFAFLTGVTKFGK